MNEVMTPSCRPRALFDETTTLEPNVLEDTGDALITRLGNQGRDRHAQEDNFQVYDHYLKLYWEDRAVSIEIVDTVGREPEGSITFNVASEFKLEDQEGRRSLGELRSQTIHPYSDLLLHDMGDGLVDPLAEGDADGAEWRTPPLWGVGLTADVNAGEAYLHDGRARNLDEAIRWHGGEAAQTRDAHNSLSPSERDALLRFLKSL